MEILLDCIPCLLRQALDAARKSSDEESIHALVLREAISFVSRYDKYENAPQLARDIHEAVRRHTATEDPYKAIKKKDLDAARELYPYLSEFIASKDDRIYWALKLSATGNNLDSAVYGEQNVKECVERELEKPFSICHIQAFKEKLAAAERILVVGDNTGESVFDRVMLEALPTEAQLIYAVRSQPIINDVTRRTAIESGLDTVAEIVSTGCGAPGAILSECSEEFLDIYRSADIVISKGQGNFEALSDGTRSVFYLLKAKCPVIAKRLDVALNSYVLKEI